MRPNAMQLAHRDAAMAALMGALPGDDFGNDPLSRSGDTRFNGLSPFDVSQNMGGMGSFGWGGGFGWDMYGADPVAATHPAARPAAAPHPAAVAAAYATQQKQAAHTDMRESLLDPNRHSTTKVERYSFSITAALVLNVASAISTTLQPNTAIRPQRIVMNAPTPNFVLLTSLFIANVNVFVGGTEDAVTYSGSAFGVMLDLPTLQPANRATVSGNYTGFVPPGFANNFPYIFVTTLQGPSTIAGGSYQ